MYFNLFNCPLNKSVCLSIDGPRLLSDQVSVSFVCLSQIVDSYDDVGADRPRVRSSRGPMTFEMAFYQTCYRSRSRVVSTESIEIEKLSIELIYTSSLPVHQHHRATCYSSIDYHKA